MSDIAKMIAIAKKFGGGGGSSAPAEVVILPETSLVFDPDASLFFILTPLSAVPAEGATAKIVYNGVEYTSPVFYNADEGNFSCVMGNTEAIGVPGGNPDAPFLVSLSPDDPEMYGMMMPMDGSTAVTMSIICEAESSNSDTSDYVIRATIDVEADTITTTQKWTKVVAATRAGRNVRICAVAGNTHLMYYCYAYTYPTTQLIFFSAPLMGNTIVRYKAERAADDSIVITVTQGLD